MKASRRHRWVQIEAYLELCRDCGLEVKSDRVKAGGLGPCAGKSSEHQNVLALMNLVPQDVGNHTAADFFGGCAGCGCIGALEMIAHHNPESGKLTGWIFSCEKCRPMLAGSKLIFVPQEEAEGE